MQPVWCIEWSIITNLSIVAPSVRKSFLFPEREPRTSVDIAGRSPLWTDLITTTVVRDTGPEVDERSKNGDLKGAQWR